MDNYGWMDSETFLKWLSHFQEHVNSCYPRQQSHDDSRQPCVSQNTVNQHGQKRTTHLSELITGSPLKKKSLSDKHEKLLLKEIAKENRKKKRSNKLEHVGEKTKKSKSVLTTNNLSRKKLQRDKNNQAK